MKKLIVTIICLIALTVAAMPVGAQTRYRNRTVWDRHRDKITTVGGAVGGALLGGLIGGKKGAAIGVITGGAGAAVYTYKIRNKHRRY